MNLTANWCRPHCSWGTWQLQVVKPSDSLADHLEPRLVDVKSPSCSIVPVLEGFEHAVDAIEGRLGDLGWRLAAPTCSPGWQRNCCSRQVAGVGSSSSGTCRCRGGSNTFAPWQEPLHHDMGLGTMALTSA